MSGVRPSVICERIRAQVSLELDGELSQLERAMLTAHLERCASCREYAAEIRAATQLLRQAPLERLGRPVVLRRPRRSAMTQLQAAAAAALFAIAVLGAASQLAAHKPKDERLSPRPAELRFPTQEQLQRELAILEAVRPGVSLPARVQEMIR